MHGYKLCARSPLMRLWNSLPLGEILESIYFLIAENSNSPKWGCIGVVFERQNTTTWIYYSSNLMACFDMIDEEFDVAHPFPVRLNPECHVTGLCDQLNTMTLNNNL